MYRIRTIVAPVSWVEVLPSGVQEDGEGSARILSGFRKNWIHLQIKFTLLSVIMRCYRNPRYWPGALGYLVRLRKKFLGNFSLTKMARVGGHYYMGLYTPGWKSRNYSRFIASELYKYKEHSQPVYRFNHVYVAITRKCPLQCEHCYAWDDLNKKDVLSQEHLHRILSRVQQLGSCQVHFTGGEPLMKYNLLQELVSAAETGTHFWIHTSGYGLTHAKAEGLKQAGITGLFISLDHFEPKLHNEFRGNDTAFHWAMEAARNACANDLVVAFSLCVRPGFVCRENLMRYLELARETGVSFVQFLEPRAVGHYAGKEVALSATELALLESFYEEMNFSGGYPDYPIINYHGYYQRRAGCFAAGEKGIYLDTKGDLHACPFCHKPYGNILDPEFERQLSALRQEGCTIY